ncbi:Uncharacterized protein ESCO_000827 [Escovopsis weberi]|uniref:WW domain-containing protein n=1 Tax=Escovopsis weberi TaxID=150374 RepID=A0A0M9VTH5_ESCWE|nr:Uncharacterized protein ESCO_000827 [Escovopsis weberi]
MERSRGIPDNEMFLSRPAPDEGVDSPTVEPLRIFKPPNAGQQPYAGQPYAGRPSFSKPSFPLPPGASSSAAPLPFPDDDDIHKPTPPKPYGSAYNDISPRLDTSSPFEKKPGLAQRRGAAPRPIQSPTSPDSECGTNDYGLFARPLNKPPAPPAPAPAAPPASVAAPSPAPSSTSYPSYQKTYYPPPGASASSYGHDLDQHPALRPTHSASPSADDRRGNDSGVNRFASTASNSTTRAGRGSPPPPETPIVGPDSLPGGGIEARYAASGIPGTATLNSLQANQAQSAAAQQRLAQYNNQPAPQRPWTPTESPDSAPSGPPTVYQGMNAISSPPPQHPALSPPPQQIQNQGNGALQLSQRETTATPGKQTTSGADSRANSGDGLDGIDDSADDDGGGGVVVVIDSDIDSDNGNDHTLTIEEGCRHPAFANDPKPEQSMPMPQVVSAPPANLAAAGPASPPPLPEGWIAHLDQNSGQYYYIHLATQATQWEFPKGPNPIQHDSGLLSPTASTYGNPLMSPMFGGGKQGMAMASPMFPPHTPGYAESIMSVAASQAPTLGFSGPPPSTGVDMYRIQPTNGVYFGPYLKYVNMDVESGKWYGSILVVTDAPQPPTIHIHLSVNLSPNPRQLQPRAIFVHQRWTFYKYEIDLVMGDATERWTYAVTSHLGCTRYEFVVAGRYETSWRFIAHSGNDFAVGTSQNERARLGGVGFMWKDVLQKNVDCGGFHVQLGLGDQIYGDRLWKEVPLMKQWLAMSGRDNKKNAQWTARHEEDVSHAYFHYYTSHFDQPYLREAFAQIPHVLQIDDHDIFDGFGSYPQYMQSSAIFKNTGRIASEMYLLFQHHTTIEIMRNVSTDHDVFTITGTGWHFIKYLGPAVVVVGPDCRSERTQSRVMAGPTYQGIFPKVATLPPSVQHVLWMVSVPIVYPRLDTMESLANTVAAGKKAVNTTYNILGKVTSSVAGVVGGKEVVAQGFSHVKKAVGKSGLMGNVLNQFGELDIQEVLKDMWTHESKDLERTYFIRTLQGIAQQKGIRMTFLSGDVNCAGAGLVHDPTHPGDHKTMYQIITSPIVSAPQSSYVLKMLHNQKTLYVPLNGQKSTHEISDTKEDMMEIFHTDASGSARELKKLMGRRNYAAFIAYDQEAAMGQGQMPFSPNPSLHSQQQGLSRLSLAVDFVVQGDGAYTTTSKYGPVIIPHLDYGR